MKNQQNIKLLQEKYADAYSKNQSIKNESIKRNERIINYQKLKLKVGKIYWIKFRKNGWMN